MYSICNAYNKLGLHKPVTSEWSMFAYTLLFSFLAFYAHFMPCGLAKTMLCCKTSAGVIVVVLSCRFLSIIGVKT